MQKVTIALAAFLIFVGGCETPMPSISKQQLRVSAQVTLAGKLVEGADAILAQRDTVVIDLRRAQEQPQVEAELFRQRGITYENLPMSGKVNAAQVAAFDELLSKYQGRDIVVHCASGNRAGLLWGAHLVTSGMSAQEALQQVDGIATKPAIKQGILNYSI